MVNRRSPKVRKTMENEAVVSKDMKVEIPEVISPPSGMIRCGGLARQGSITKYNCLCSPTTHAGSFRCRLHRGPSLQRTKSIDSPAWQDSETKVTTSANCLPSQNNAQPASLQRTKSIESSACQDSETKVATGASCVPTQNNAFSAQE